MEAKKLVLGLRPWLQIPPLVKSEIIITGFIYLFIIESKDISSSYYVVEKLK